LAPKAAPATVVVGIELACCPLIHLVRVDHSVIAWRVVLVKEAFVRVDKALVNHDADQNQNDHETERAIDEAKESLVLEAFDLGKTLVLIELADKR